LNAPAAAKIVVAFEKIADGNFSNVDPVGEGVSEYKLDWGPGSANQHFHHRISILVNEHSTSVSEMLTQFAKENQLATIIGTKTPGRSHLSVCVQDRTRLPARAPYRRLSELEGRSY
jgi:C-terminal processing protease CtpA/Prc